MGTFSPDREGSIDSRSRINRRAYLLAVDQFLDTGRMPDHADLALLALRRAKVFRAVVALLGQVLIVVLHDDAEDDVASFIHAVDNILVEILVLRRNVRRSGHLSAYPPLLAPL